MGWWALRASYNNIRLPLRQAWHGEHEEDEKEKDVVECGQAAQDLHQGALELHLAVVQHLHREEVAQEAKDRDDGHHAALHHELEGADAHFVAGMTMKQKFNLSH